jgi:hypothetical protein
MIQASQGQRFFAEAFVRDFVGESSRRQNFDRHVAVELFIVRAIDYAHPAGTDLFHDLVMRQPLSNHRGTTKIFLLASSRTAAYFSRGRDLPRHHLQGDPFLRPGFSSMKPGSAGDDATLQGSS